MSELDQLRELLIAKGMEYREHEAPATDCIAFFDGNGWHDCWESVDGEVNVTFSMTPAQAIAATLGRGTCHTVAMDCFGNPPFNQSGLNGNSTACGCSECGAPWSTMGIFRGNLFKHNFKACPICGREVDGWHLNGTNGNAPIADA